MLVMPCEHCIDYLASTAAMRYCLCGWPLEHDAECAHVAGHCAWRRDSRVWTCLCAHGGGWWHASVNPRAALATFIYTSSDWFEQQSNNLISGCCLYSICIELGDFMVWMWKRLHILLPLAPLGEWTCQLYHVPLERIPQSLVQNGLWGWLHKKYEK